jgi:hypothetical protein
MEKLTTFRRDKLRRLIEAGRVVSTSTYSFDDMTGESRSTGRIPVAIAPRDWRDRKEGLCYLRPDEFEGKSGACYTRGEDRSRVTLIVHSNSSYQFEVLGPV